jgi:hypothetical protein
LGGYAVCRKCRLTALALALALLEPMSVLAQKQGADFRYDESGNLIGIVDLSAYPQAPSSLTATTTSPSTVNLRWTDNSNNEAGFLIEMKTEGGTYSQIATVAANVATYLVSNLSDGKTYYYRVRASNGYGTSDYSNESSASTKVPPNAPSNLVATVTSGTTISLSWKDNATTETSFAIAWMARNGCDVSKCYWVLANVPSDVTSYVVSGLSAGVNYDLLVTASNDYGTSGVARANVTTVGPPPAPSALCASSLGTTVTLTWSDRSSNESAFLLEMKAGVTGSYSQIASVSANATTYSVPALTNGIAYYFRLRATNGYGTSKYTDEATVTVCAAGGCPAAPSGLVASQGYPGQVVLSWADNSNNETGFSIENLSGVTFGTVGANVRTTTVNNLSGGYTYSFRVRAKNGSAYSGYSNTVSVAVSYYSL